MFKKPNTNDKKIQWVAIFENNPYPIDARLRPHMEALAAVGYDVTVISMQGKGQPTYEIINGVQVYRFFLPTYSNNAFGYGMEFFHATLTLTFLTLWVWLRHGLDILHVYNPPDSLFVAALLPKLAGKTIIFDLRDLSPELYASKYERTNSFLVGILIWMERAAIRLADHVITVNESYRDIILKRTGLAPQDISIIRQGPDLDRVYSTEPDPAVRSRAKTIIAYLGSMAKEDGIDHLLQALHYLETDFSHKDWFCMLIGPSKEFETLKKLSNELNISDRVWFTGYQKSEDWIRLLSAADICIEPAPSNPVNNISTTNKIMDYMALGKPSIGYGLSEQRITAGDAAIYALPNDPKDMARQIALLIENPALRVQMGTLGRERIKQHLAWQRQKERFIALCGDVANHNSSRKTDKAPKDLCP